ncbi:type I polyketide synthase [Tundrisphaera lichenicola]|uniref:type I polyketide synthase n=1 Tax=Tundrisphaera lichenicola TaxID=2029860 RepID=UPI003EBC78FA
MAIVGMSAIMPGAEDVRTFWEHTLRGFNAITEVPADRWDWRLYYDSDPKAPDKIISKWGGFLPDIPFDPLRYGMPPSSLPSIEPVQLLLLEATRSAIEDAGYTDRPFDRERTAVVLGMGGGAAQVAMGYAFRSYLPMLDTVRPGAGRDALTACEGLLPEWTEDSFPGFLLNVAAGRVANRFDLGGANYTVDAACGSSLAAANLAVRELETGSADVVLLGGADTVQNPFTYLAFSKTQAFSPRGRCRPFDASADGIVISEGVAVLVLKRLSDAERDGDRIYSVIKGLGASSDGRARGLTAPSSTGQVRAVRRAYEKAGVSPSTVGYVEAHGTGTAVGDVVEVNALSEVYRESGVPASSVAIGSVKSMIGHTKCAAGLAGLINASLALHHKVLPPTIGVEVPNPKADLFDGPFRVSTETRPWIHDDPDHPRRAGVSAFGFGGTNFHAVLEAYEGPSAIPTAPIRDWPAELFAWRLDDPARLLEQIDDLTGAMDRGASPALRDLARAVQLANPPRSAAGSTLAIVAGSVEDLRAKLRSARDAIHSGSARLEDPRGVFYERSPAYHGSPVAFLFPGQGSQSVGMLGELAVAFFEICQAFDDFDTALNRAGRSKVGPLIFPPGGFDQDFRERAETALKATEAAQPALGAASVGLLRLLKALGVEADLVGGHSYGELVALHAAGSIRVEDLAALSSERGRLMTQALGDDPGGMAAISTGAAEVDRLILGLDGLVAVNRNGPRQTVIAGPLDQIAEAVERATRTGYRARTLSVAGAFHTARMAPVSGPLADFAAARIGSRPKLPVYSNLDARPHPGDPSEISRRLGEHLASPVQFESMIGAMHEDGARVFVEVGPGSVLTSLVNSILGDRPHLSVACEGPGKTGLVGLLTMLARLVASGVPVRLDRLAHGRSERVLDLEYLPIGDGSAPHSATTWLVNGSRARPIDQPEPRRLGQGPVLPLTSPGVLPMASAPTNGTTNGYHEPGGLKNGKPSTMNRPIPPGSRPPDEPARSSADDRVLLAFQETMKSFLEVQRSTMLAYLASRQVGPRTEPDPRPNFLPDPIADRIARRPAPVPVKASKPEPRPEPVKEPEAPPTIFVEEASAPADTAPSKGREAVAARLVEIVRDRTGYPAEMLGLDLDLEADLGIDSIKRVEILGTLRDSLPEFNGWSESSTMEALSRAKTLGSIVDRVSESLGNSTESAPETDPSPQLDPTSEPVARLILESVPSPISQERSGLLAGGVVAITDDGRGIAQAVASELREAGHPVVLAGPDLVDFRSPSGVDRWLQKARNNGRLAGIIHLLPLREAPGAGLDPSAWATRMGEEVRGLFLLAKAAGPDLERASRQGDAAFVAATGMGGTFGSAATHLDFFPGQGGVAGLVKTLAREWPGVRSRVVDLDPRDKSRVLADRLLTEILSDDDWSEVGYDGGRRVRLKAVASPLKPARSPEIELAPGEPVLVTGGARGITATLTAELARRWRPTLLVLGRSPLPGESEDLETSRIDSPVDLKAVLHARLRQGKGRVSPADLERAYRSTLGAREIRANLAAFRSAGATVEYAPVDVRDPAALGPILERWRRKFGDPVGLIHGAGVIQDKLIRDKTLESFDQVVGTKIDGVLNLARLLRPDPIRFAALFSSIAGRFGNLGQSDYAVANEVLNKLAIWLDRRWSGRVVSMIWGPWSGVGMVSDLEEHLGAQGLGMIRPETGRSLLIDELTRGRKGEVEVIAAGALGTFDGPVQRSSLAGSAR